MIWLLPILSVKVGKRFFFFSAGEWVQFGKLSELDDKTAVHPQMGGIRLNKYPPKHTHTHTHPTMPKAAKRHRPGTRWWQPARLSTAHNPPSVTDCPHTLSAHEKFLWLNEGWEARRVHGWLRRIQKTTGSIRTVLGREYKIQIDNFDEQKSFYWKKLHWLLFVCILFETWAA